MADTDIYRDERKKEEQPDNTVLVSEDTEFEDDISDVLQKQFNSSKKKSNLVDNIPSLIQLNKTNNYEKLFKGISESDISNLDI